MAYSATRSVWFASSKVVTQGITRRAMLTLLPGSWMAAQTVSTKKGRPLPRVGEFVRFADPTTENLVVRLTNPTSTSILPAAANRFVSLRERFLVFSSDRAGQLAPFQVDLRNGLVHQLAAPKNLAARSLCLDEKERFVYFLDGTTLEEVNLATRKIRTVAEDVSAFSLGAEQGRAFVVRKGELHQLGEEGARVLAEDVSAPCLAQPKGPGCLFTRQISDAEKELWYVPVTPGGEGKGVRLASGPISDPFWSRDGQCITFLRDVQTPNALLSEVHEVSSEGGLERRVASTSQFAVFAPNGDGSVFVGASRSKAQPNIILLLRSPQRELTLCEHHASNPLAASPSFSPDSRRVYFQSDREGKPAIYSVNVELLVEPTVPNAD